ncbi:bifunctional [glutamine synthetase] adenylyltransferase/[glutamine synthetase]-adenylyl-L-tyrosine phosphorylase [Aquicoccus sp. SCR17]|nr:bifunctional [glutamine synthetase] adenylyltransferase/[glutamine synthetase]-adenylyl-L-tyrosine phosphorylase [Carideicomes alvinocaridis]
MTLASRMTRLPRPFDPDRGAEARAAVPEAEGDLAKLLEGAGGSSPYLKGLIEKEAAWLRPALDDPDGEFDALLAGLPELAPGALQAGLRQAKRRAALIIGLCDLAGAWPLEEVTGRLTALADAAGRAALQEAVAREIRRGKLPGATEDDIPEAAGITAFAMGKMGAGELNYSSDIDLICLFDETRYERDSYQEARQALVRATRRMAGTLGDLTADGYVFRTDLRLRPDPAVTPVCMAMAAAETYYESLGRTWERAAWIKARPAFGDLEAGARFQEALRPFVWRKHLDFAAIRDAHDIRLRIREHKGLGGPITLPGHDLKLGRGGIREIEFFTQTRQLIAGGRDPELRERGTVAGLAALAEKEWIPDSAARSLTEHYTVLREMEHRVQIVADAQTHRLPGSPDEMERLAALCGRDRDGLEAELMERLTEVHELTEGFFAKGREGLGDVPPEAEVVEEAGFDASVMSRWPGYPALRSARAVEIFDRLRPGILERLSRTAAPEEALLAFDGFLAGLPAGVQLFSLFESNPQLLDLLIDIVGTAPALARHLSRNSGVFDAVIGGDFFADWPGEAALTEELAEAMAREADYERKLDLARRWGKEWHFRTGVHLLRGLVGAEAAGAQYADLAGAMLRALLPEVQAEFARKHGAPPGRGAVVLGMGSLGARRLTAVSDLDLIVIYDPEGAEASEGRRPLAARTYYARLTQALVTAMTAPMSEGRLYDVDMRLRPSGSQGPVATSWESFRNYQRGEAWIWEHLALTRARVVAGDDGLAADVESFRAEIVGRGREAAEVLTEVARMRERIAAAKSPEGPWDAKIGPGRMQDVELLAQAGALIAGAPCRDVTGGLEAGQEAGLWSPEATERLGAAYRLFWQVQVASKLLSERPLDSEAAGEGGISLLLRVTGRDSLSALERDFAAAARRAAETVTEIVEAQ